MDSAVKFLLECVALNGSTEESAKARWFLDEAYRESLGPDIQRDAVVEAVAASLDDDRVHESLSAMVRKMVKEEAQPPTKVVDVQSMVDSHPVRKPSIYFGGR